MPKVGLKEVIDLAEKIDEISNVKKKKQKSKRGTSS
jgi:hypothetical protein